jgi:hypothetical protein
MNRDRNDGKSCATCNNYKREMIGGGPWPRERCTAGGKEILPEIARRFGGKCGPGLSMWSGSGGSVSAGVVWPAPVPTQNYPQASTPPPGLPLVNHAYDWLARPTLLGQSSPDCDMMLVRGAEDWIDFAIVKKPGMTGPPVFTLRFEHPKNTTGCVINPGFLGTRFSPPNFSAGCGHAFALSSLHLTWRCVADFAFIANVAPHYSHFTGQNFNAHTRDGK